MARKLAAASVICLLFALAVSKPVAQDNLTSELYGQGVHAYFAGDFNHAHQFLTLAVDQGTKDPRCYYFRGLAYARLGRPDEAEADFKRGAEIEASGAAVQIDIGGSLQRVQGSIRLDLERHRSSARMAAKLKQATERRDRYEESKRDEARAVRDPAAVPPAPQPGVPAAEPADAPAINDPFAAPAKPGAGPAPESPAPVEPGAAKPPVGEQKPAELDPFATPPAGEKPAAEKPAEDAGADPFATLPAAKPAAGEPPAAEDPFGAPAKPADTPEMEPGKEPAAPAADDPFGAPAKPADKPEAAPGKEPAAPAADEPFGEPVKPAKPAKPAVLPAGKVTSKTPAKTPAAKDDAGLLGGNEDPFGAPEAIGPAKKPSGKPEAKDAGDEKTDPFADDPMDEKPAAKPADEAAKPGDAKADPFAP